MPRVGARTRREVDEASACAMKREAVGVRAIALYKSVKAALEAAAAIVVLALLPLGLAARLRSAAILWRHHLAQSWSLYAAAWIVNHATSRWLEVTVLALAMDAALSGLEAWALYHDAWWGAWVVVATTASLLPLEVQRVIRRPSALRFSTIIANLLIVAYLARQARRPHA